MSRYRGPRLRITRRLGDLPGFTSKTTERNYPPGQHGAGKAIGAVQGRRNEQRRPFRRAAGMGRRPVAADEATFGPWPPRPADRSDAA